MSNEEQTSNQESLQVVEEPAAIDVNSIDFKNPDTIPEELKQLPLFIPTHGVKRPLYKIMLSNPFAIPKAKVRTLWYEGQLLTESEYRALPAEQTFAYRNKITKRSKNK